MQDHLPPLNWLRVFEVAARHGSFAHAAAELNMTPSAVSQQIRALESHLGTPLFTRHPRSVELNAVGRAFLPSVQHSILSIRNTAHALFGSAEAKVFHLHAILLFAHGILAPRFAKFQTEFPNLVMHLTTSAGAVIVRDEPADLNIVFGSDVMSGDHCDLLLHETLFPVALPEIAARIQSPEDLLRYTLIDVSTHQASWPYLLEVAGVSSSRARVQAVDNSPLAYSLASCGAGIAIAHAPTSDLLVSQAGLVPCLDGFQAKGLGSFFLTCSTLSQLPPPAALFREWLLKEVRNIGSQID